MEIIVHHDQPKILLSLGTWRPLLAHWRPPRPSNLPHLPTCARQHHQKQTTRFNLIWENPGQTERLSWDFLGQARQTFALLRYHPGQPAGDNGCIIILISISVIMIMTSVTSDHHDYDVKCDLGFPDVWVFLIVDHHRPLQVDSKLTGRDLRKNCIFTQILWSGWMATFPIQNENSLDFMNMVSNVMNIVFRFDEYTVSKKNMKIWL